MNEFLNPKSMATPGAAGTMVMFVTNAICFQFPEIEVRWTAIILSFFAGAIVFSAKELHFTHRAAFWVLNSLIIFSVGVGTSNIAAKTQQLSPNVQAATEKHTLLELILPAARAEGSSDQSETALRSNAIESQLAAITKQLEQQTQLILNLQEENRKLREELTKFQTEAAPDIVDNLNATNNAHLIEKQRIRHEIQSIKKQSEAAIQRSPRDAFFKAW